MKLFNTYFQKSKVFLYPLLGIAKGIRFVPEQTYMAWKDHYHISDMKLICVYKNKLTKGYLKFEETKLFKNKYFFDYSRIGSDMHVYIFDLSLFPQTLVAFTEGLYSKINEREKQTILDFFGEKGVIATTIESYLYPEYYHEDYAEKLNVSLELISKVHEVCDKPNLDKETLEKKTEEINIIKNNTVSLSTNKT